MAYIYFDSTYAPCAFLIVRDGGDPYKEQDTVLIQTDWDYPGVAGRMGFSLCHSDTDGTVDCPVCGKTAGDMISSAYDHIADHAGERFVELDEYLPQIGD